MCWLLNRKLPLLWSTASILSFCWGARVNFPTESDTYLPTIDRYDYGGAAFAGMVLFPMPSWGWVYFRFLDNITGADLQRS
jgi:hypothetical protein